MAPTNHHVINQLRQLIYYHLDCNLLNNAVFVAGRLQAYEPRAAEAAHLLALCHLRLGQLKAAYESSKNFGSRGTHLGCAYVFAQACLGLGRCAEGATALERSKGLWSTRSNWNKATDVRRQHLPDASAVFGLLGKLLAAYGDRNRAIDSFSESLNRNPFMWDAFQGLCDLGAELRLPNVFRLTPEMMSSIAVGGSEEMPLGLLEDAVPHASTGQSTIGNGDPLNALNRFNGEPRHQSSKSALYEKSNPSSNLFTPTAPPEILPDGMETPTALAGTAPTKLKDITTIREDRASVEPPAAPARRTKPVAGPLDWTAEAPPPRIKTSTSRPKTRLHEESHDGDPAHLAPPALFTSGITERKRTVSGQVAHSVATSSGTQGGSANIDTMAPQRRSVRILNSLTRPQTKPNVQGTTTSAAREARELKKPKPMSSKARTGHAGVGRAVSGNRQPGEPMDVDGKERRALSTTNIPIAPMTKPTVADKAKEQESLQWLIDLFLKLGTGHYNLSRYRCQEAFNAFSAIPQGQRETPWVLAQIARALYEQGQYAEAEKYFLRLRTMTKSRLDDLEIYSTILWHQKREIELAHLAHEATEQDRLSPQAWCAVGNAFSLQRDHDNALKCFQRATQLDPKFAYAFTLQGHEHTANEEHDQALAAYRQGMAADRRHYNAWYGLGRVYERQGKYALAEQHYAQAARINPTNAVLLCCVGGVLEKMRRMPQALDAYERSIRLAPRSSLARYKKARVLVMLSQPVRALDELRELKDLAPDEANVHFLLGRVYRQLREKGNAIKHFTTALNLDPKVRFHTHFHRFSERSDTVLNANIGIASHQGGYGGDGRPR